MLPEPIEEGGMLREDSRLISVALFTERKERQKVQGDLFRSHDRSCCSVAAVLFHLSSDTSNHAPADSIAADAFHEIGEWGQGAEEYEGRGLRIKLEEVTDVALLRLKAGEVGGAGLKREGLDNRRRTGALFEGCEERGSIRIDEIMPKGIEKDHIAEARGFHTVGDNKMRGSYPLFAIAVNPEPLARAPHRAERAVIAGGAEGRGW